LVALSACQLDFDVDGRAFDCPADVAASGCSACNSDGSCRVFGEIGSEMPDPPLPHPTRPSLPDAAVPTELPVPPDASVVHPPDPPPEPMPEAGPAPDPPLPDAGTTGPGSEICRDYQSRASDSLCLEGAAQCFSLGSVLSPSLAAWLDPTTLPQDGSRYWCDRSGQRHHARLVPDTKDVAIETDGRAVSDALARSLLLDGSWLSLDEGTLPALAAGNFAVLVAAAALETPEPQAFELFESGEVSPSRSKINLSIVQSTGKAEGRISTMQTALVTSPVVTRSSVDDGGFHLFSLYRRSEVQVLDDVLQLRLNGVLEFRSSSIAIPRALDLSSTAQPISVGSRGTATSRSATGRGRIAAVVILRGSIPEDELARLENFMCSALGVCAAPGSTATR